MVIQRGAGILAQQDPPGDPRKSNEHGRHPSDHYEPPSTDFLVRMSMMLRLDDLGLPVSI